MIGLMQDWPLTIDRILEHARIWHGGREIITQTPDGSTERTTYADLHAKARKISAGLLALGIVPGDRVATLAMNSASHMEAWYGIMGIGAVCHTLNPRLFTEQIVYIINHAQDRVIFVEPAFCQMLDDILLQCPCVEIVIVMGDAKSMAFSRVVRQDELHEGAQEAPPWGGFEESTACGLCYTSGTTGDPKGVLYSHRSNFLHTLYTLQPDALNLSVNDTILPIVPMFHANAWGLAFSAPAVGAKLVLPGPRLDGASIHRLIESEGVTFSAAVPTVWQSLLDHLKSSGSRLGSLRRVVIGGAACPESLIRIFKDDYGVDVIHAWGMTETSPLGTISTTTPELERMDNAQRMSLRLKQGRPPLGIELKLQGDDGVDLPHDGKTFGRLKVKGAVVAASYFQRDSEQILDEAGFFDTGDIATIDPHGYMQITDRAKDVIKSGGEWISSIEIENITMGHPKAAAAAVIGIPHPKWDERPLLLVELRFGESATVMEMRRHLDGKIAKWWTPDDVVFIDELPLGATGKIDKKVLRAQFDDHYFK